MGTDEKIGLMAFSTKKAETEPWLVKAAFVAPPDFEFLKGDYSTIIYGEPGSGKTAICLALEHYANLRAKRLVVHWKPSSIENKVKVSTSLAMAQLSNILYSCGQTLIEYLSEAPAVLKNASRSAKEFLIWFIRRYGLSNPEGVIPKKLGITSGREKELLQYIKPIRVREFFGKKADPIMIAVELTKALEQVGFSRVWIMLDGLEWHTNSHRQALINSLSSMLSTLRLFEIPSLSYKMMLPMDFESELAESTSITRNRAMVFRLTWDTKYLSAIVERRLSVALGDNNIKLENIYNIKDILAWLEGCGGLSPRGWIEYLRPIFSTYWDVLAHNKLRQLTKSEWNSARSRSSLHLKFYPEENQIKIGMGNPRTLSPETAAIFSYLHDNQGRFCTKRELYYKAYVPYATPQAKVKEVGEQVALKKEYEDMLNSAMSRLKKTVEPVPNDPVFITSKRDAGYRLTTQAFQ